MNPDSYVQFPCSRIIFLMARGWESKSVEEQQSEAVAQRPRNQLITPEQAAKQRQKAGLSLSRNRVLQQLSVAKNSAHRQMLERALADLDSQLTQLG